MQLDQGRDFNKLKDNMNLKILLWIITQLMKIILRISVQLSHSVMSNFCNPMDCSTPDFPVHHQSQSLLKLMSIMSVMPSKHLILCHPLLPPSLFPSIRVFSNELILRIRWPKYWSYSFSISPSNEYSELISFRMDWLDLPAVQGTLQSLLQHHSSKASTSKHSEIFEIL